MGLLEDQGKPEQRRRDQTPETVVPAACPLPWSTPSPRRRSLHKDVMTPCVL